MREPKKISVPSGTGWIAPEEGQPEDGVWQGRIYDITWKFENDTIRVGAARVAFRKIRTVKLLGRFTLTVAALKVGNITIYPHEHDNRLLTGRVQGSIISNALDEHAISVDSDFLEWVLAPAETRIAGFRAGLLKEMHRGHPMHLRSVA